MGGFGEGMNSKGNGQLVLRRGPPRETHLTLGTTIWPCLIGIFPTIRRAILLVASVFFSQSISTVIVGTIQLQAFFISTPAASGYALMFLR